MAYLRDNIAKIQADYIINSINKLECSREDKLRLIDSIIADIRSEGLEHLNKAI